MQEEFIFEIDFLPTVPTELIESLENIELRENASRLKIPEAYASRYTSHELHNWAQSFFDYPIAIRWQIQYIDLPPHIDFDYAKTGFKYIYYVDLGGKDVRTCYYASTEPDSKIIYEKTPVVNTWYSIKIDKPHGTIGLSVPPRVSLFIKKFIP